MKGLIKSFVSDTIFINVAFPFNPLLPQPNPRTSTPEITVHNTGLGMLPD